MNDEILKAVSGIFTGPTGGIRLGMVALGVLSLCDALILNKYSVCKNLKDNKDMLIQPASECSPKKIEASIGAANNTSV